MWREPGGESPWTFKSLERFPSPTPNKKLTHPLTRIDKFASSSHQEAEMVAPEETSAEVHGFTASFFCLLCVVLSERLMPLGFLSLNSSPGQRCCCSQLLRDGGLELRTKSAF